MASYVLDISPVFLYTLVLCRKAVVARCGKNIHRTIWVYMWFKFFVHHLGDCLRWGQTVLVVFPLGDLAVLVWPRLSHRQLRLWPETQASPM